MATLTPSDEWKTREFRIAHTLSPERFHRSRHDGPYDSCRRCGLGRAKCRRKQRYDSWDDADAAARVQNEERGYDRPVVPYFCRECTYWHKATAKGKTRVRRAEKARRAWLVARAS